MGEAVRVGLRTRIRHGVDGKRDVKAMLICLTGGRFHSGSGSYASQDDLGDALRFQLAFEIGARKCSLHVRLVTTMSSGCLFSSGSKSVNPLRQRRSDAGATPVRPEGTTRYIDEHNREAMLPSGTRRSTRRTARMTPEIGWIEGKLTVPFCRSTTISAVFASIVVTGIRFFFGEPA